MLTTWELILGIIDLVLCVLLIAVVLFQHGKSAGLSGTISGGAETFFGKTKGRTIDRILSKLTGVIAVLFVAVTIILTGMALIK